MRHGKLKKKITFDFMASVEFMDVVNYGEEMI